ncbi:MAG: nucleoside-diphosphate kinase [Deltaproteobacteria bacterium]|nr:nucleoside-diphosphate kinase [Deltaproteobacteria bacterium]
MMERTLTIVKPDAVARGLIGEVIKRLEQAGFKIIAMKMVYLTKEQAEEFYGVHRGTDFFEGFTAFMCSGPSIVMVLEGEEVITKSRKLMGATNPKDAAEGTIRREFATDGRRNVVHGSDSPETAAFEIDYFFNASEIFA